VKIVVVDPHATYRRGNVASLELEGEHAAEAAGSAADPAFEDGDVVILDGSMSGAIDLIRAAGAAGARVIVCATDDDAERARAALAAGAIGYLPKVSLTPEMLHAAIKAATAGAAMVAPALLARALRASTPKVQPTRPGVLTGREQRVLTLAARGHPTREIAAELSYSERTVKNVLRDIVTKLNARSRSQAIANAVREGLI
jgi:DNA-binding NarL/FixJ family response regulator